MCWTDGVCVELRATHFKWVIYEKIFSVSNFRNYFDLSFIGKKYFKLFMKDYDNFRECASYEFSTEHYGKTIATEWKLMCGRSAKVEVLQVRFSHHNFAIFSHSAPPGDVVLKSILNFSKGWCHDRSIFRRHWFWSNVWRHGPSALHHVGADHVLFWNVRLFLYPRLAKIYGIFWKTYIPSARVRPFSRWKFDDRIFWNFWLKDHGF